MRYLPTYEEHHLTAHDPTIVALGRRVASLESHLLDASSRIYATASSTCLILQPEQRTT